MQGGNIMGALARGGLRLAEVAALLQLLVQLPLGRILQDEEHPLLRSPEMTLTILFFPAAVSQQRALEYDLISSSSPGMRS